MAIIYATLIIKGKKTFADVPDRIKDKVKEARLIKCHPQVSFYHKTVLVHRFYFYTFFEWS